MSEQSRASFVVVVVVDAAFCCTSRVPNQIGRYMNDMNE